MNWSSLPSTPSGSRTYNDGAYENWTLDTSSVTTAAAPATIIEAGLDGRADPHRRHGHVLDRLHRPGEHGDMVATISDRVDKRGVSYVSSSATSPRATTRPRYRPRSRDLDAHDHAHRRQLDHVRWTLADPIDNSGNPLPYGFTLSFTVRYNGLNGAAWEMWPAGTTAPAQLHQRHRVSAVARRLGGRPAPNQASNSNSVATTVRQPLIRTVKSIVTTVTPPPFVGGSPIRYRIT